MAMNFQGKKVSDLQQYLKDRGVTANFNKASLVEMCEEAYRLNIEIDPDGLLEDRQHIINSKLTKESGELLPNPGSLMKDDNLSQLPTVTIIEIYNYLIQSQFNSHENLRDHKKMEGYTMKMDGHVHHLSACTIGGHPGYFVLDGKVKPRTRDVDPVTKLKLYDSWIILTSISNRSTSIYSAFCVCKGGIDGYCRHIVAVLFEFMEYVDDYSKTSVTSGPCLWVRKSTHVQESTLATKIKTNITNIGCDTDSDDDWYDPFPKGVPLPDPAKLLELTKEALPNACMLDAFEVRPKEPVKEYLQPNVMAPMEKLIIFFNCHECTPSSICDSNCFEELLVDMSYNENEIEQIEAATRDQHLNPWWHEYRKGLLTASNFRTLIHTKNKTKCALNMLKGTTMDEDDLPWHIEYGRDYEAKARDLFIKTHKYEHKKCSVRVPGLCTNANMSILGASPDGILTCNDCDVKQRLIEIKCLSSKRNYTPVTALILLDICSKTSDGNLKMNEDHKYYYQIQGQMGVTGITQCWFVAYTNKGIHPLLIDFDFDLWLRMIQKLYDFYRYGYMHVIKGPFA